MNLTTLVTNFFKGFCLKLRLIFYKLLLLIFFLLDKTKSNQQKSYQSTLHSYNLGKLALSKNQILIRMQINLVIVALTMRHFLGCNIVISGRQVKYYKNTQSSWQTEIEHLDAFFILFANEQCWNFNFNVNFIKH